LDKYILNNNNNSWNIFKS